MSLNPIWQATLAGVFTWLMTALGSSLVFLFHEVNDKLLAIMNGFAAGVMVAASYWSLLAPSIDFAEQNGYGIWSFVPALIGFLSLNPIWQATLAGVFTWLMTALGSSLVFLFHEVNDKLLAIMNGFAAGVMVAASYWSLLAPSIDFAEQNGYGIWSFVPALVGF